MQRTDILVIGAGPVGLFTVFEAGLLGLRCELVDNLDKPGGQCAELYPEKPIYDIPGVPFQTGQEHVDALLKQISPFEYGMHLGQRVDSLEQVQGENGAEWRATTSEGLEFVAPNVFIAAGAGAFEPRKPTGIEDVEAWEGKGLEYAVRDRSRYAGKDVVIFGGGDSALDWTVELAAEARSLTLVHRRDAFRGAPHTEAEMRRLVQEGTVQLCTPYLIHDIGGDGKVQRVQVRNFSDESLQELPADEILFLFGLHKKLGPILEWGVGLDGGGKKIAVNTESFQTDREGIFAVGDINTYPGKLDLILSGFHETTLACQEAFRRCHPGERVPFGYTTSNAKLQEKLKVG